jgi:aminopeptidase
MFFSACLIDWKAETAKWRQWAERLSGAARIHITGRETDLRFSVKGRKWMLGDGKMNMPDGEIATSPVSETLDGQIYFEFPGVLGGRLMQDIRLHWKQGKLVEARSSTHQDFLEAILATDAGASLIGEFAMGTNPGLTRYCKDILLDEKMRGTVHIALGRAYPQCGGTNESAIHWDIIKDLRSSGAVSVDDQPILENGVILL